MNKSELKKKISEIPSMAGGAKDRRIAEVLHEMLEMIPDKKTTKKAVTRITPDKDVPVGDIVDKLA